MPTNEAVSQILDQVPVLPPQGDKNPMGGASTDALAPPASTPAKADDKVSSRIEVLIKREQAARQREEAAKQRELELQAKLQRIEEFESAKGNSKKALELLGLNYDELTQSMLKDGEIPPEVQIKKVEDKFEAYRREQEAEAGRRAEDAKQAAVAQEQKAIENFKSEINTYLGDNNSRYELIKFEDQSELVFDVIDAHYNRTLQAHVKELTELGEDASRAVGKVMSIAEAADKVEQHLEQKYNKSRELKKVQTLWNAVPKEIQSKAVQQTKASSQKPQTLTNQLASTPTPPRATPISDEERVQRAIAYAKGLRPG